MHKDLFAVVCKLIWEEKLANLNNDFFQNVVFDEIFPNAKLINYRYRLAWYDPRILRGFTGVIDKDTGFFLFKHR
jgi:hypothetical protein